MLRDLSVNLLMSIAGAPVFNLVRENIADRVALDDKAIEAAIAACWDAIKI